MDETMMAAAVGILALILVPLALLGALAAIFGADTRLSYGDDHTGHSARPWI